MPRIRILDDKTINQIAAGEVIENPASVVKELIENAIDAGATRIIVETKAGGRGLIKVSDNGCGMGQDDLVLSVERHATSKLAAVEGLNTLRTLGFRGEALPSIASISKMSLHTAAISGEGHSLSIEGGRIGKLMPQARQKGTTVEVTSLFFNVPVRKKFQKSVNSDTAEIHKILTKFTLSYSFVGFEWMNDDKQMLAFTPQSLMEERYQFLLGEEFVHQSVNIDKIKEPFSLKGILSLPSLHRPSRSGQHLFVNGRAIYSSFVGQKVLEGYGMHLPSRRFPLFVLHLDLPPSWIDVNVHPQKKEIRIKEEEALSDFIIQAVSNALHKPPPISTKSFSMPPIAMTACEPLPVYKTELKELDTPLFVSDICILTKIDHYFFLEEHDGVRVVNILRALERILFDELSAKNTKKGVQNLLIPIQLTKTGKDKILLMDCMQQLCEIGIGIRHFGGDTFIIDAIPEIVEPSEIPDLIDLFLEKKTVPIQLGKCLKRGPITLETGKFLIKKLMRCANPQFTPNGELVYYLLDKSTLGKLI